jgi:ribosomal-protein-alanine N-acetyltransferase
MNIRAARSEDVAAMVALVQQAPSAAHWAESFYLGIFEGGAADRVCLAAEEVAEKESLMHGFLVARIIGDECELESIVVAETSQRRGFGRKLIGALIVTESVRERNVTRIFLEVRESNAAARALYQNCGFAISGRRASYYSDPAEDAILYKAL